MIAGGPIQYTAAFAAAFLAGAINSVAGGGTLVTFPMLLWLGLPSVTANATNTVAIWPGSLGSLWGFRRELAQTDPRMRWMVIPCLLGGGTGAMLLRMTPPGIFDQLVPFLILFATVLFSLQPVVQRWLGHRASGWFAGAMVFQFLVGVYGGYFGAGMGIMMLTALSLMGMTDILKMNALTSLFALCINGVAAILFIAAGMVYWPFVLTMAVGAILGGYGAAGIARRVGKKAVRRCVIAIGFTIALVLFVRMAAR
ncbi:MAG: sulfite exporter TauE/SafE family protein [Terriglobia bacterium]